MGHVEDHYLVMAYQTAALSHDPDTQNGAVIVTDEGLAVAGCNGIPDALAFSPERLTRPEKYKWILHAEHVAVVNASKLGLPVQGATMYCPWFSCDQCALNIVQSGIARVVGHSFYYHAANPLWDPVIETGIGILQEAGISMDWVETPVRGAPKVRVAGKMFDPASRE